MFEDCNASYGDIVDLIQDKNIVAIFQGRTEAGPRALGNRSILYDPRDPGAQKFVNRVKGREWWRPIAATVLFEHAHDWFEMMTLKESPFMMYSIPVKEDKKQYIPGVLHVDDTCRIQAVTDKQNYHFYKLIECFYKETDIPMLFNTSFNLAGDVICHTLEHALQTLASSEINYLYLPEEDKLIQKK